MIRLELETVTPMFLHGPESQVLELRPPPFKALFRYWWRATRSLANANKLRDQEGALFGNTKKKSPLLIHISGAEKLNQEDYQPLPHHQGGHKCETCQPHEKPCRKGYTNEAYNPDQPFKIRLAAPNLKSYEKIAELSFLLGGVGNRSRRGFGSIRATSWDFLNIGQLRNRIWQTLNDVAHPGGFVISAAGVIEAPLPLGGLPGYPVIHKIFFGQPNPSFESLLKSIGQATHNHDNDALGYAYPGKRLASPIHVRVQKVDNNYFPIVTQLDWSYLARDLVKQQAFIDEIIA